MAKRKTKSEDEGEEVGEGESILDGGGRGGKKKLIIAFVVVLLGLFAAKTFLLSAAPKTAAQLATDKQAAAVVLYNKCAEANELPKTADSSAPDATTDKGSAPSVHRQATTGAKLAEGAVGGTLVEGMGPILSLDSVTVNLVDGHYLKLGLALQLDVGGDATVAKDEGLGAKALDMALSTLEKYTMRELIAPARRESIKHALGLRTCEAYRGAVLVVYFTEFVMQ